MEDTARLALIEMYVNNEKDFEKFLNELLQLTHRILDNPHDFDFRKVKSDALKALLKCEDFCAYLKYIGFKQQTDGFVFPQEETLSKLKLAQAAIVKKITYCFGPERCSFTSNGIVQQQKKISQLTAVDVLTTTNPFLQSIQTLFNNVLKYEDEELQEIARAHIPLMRLQLRAFERMREYQKKIKTGEVSGEDLSFDMALLAELLSWFKYKFFTWVDKPACALCGGPTRLSTKVSRFVEGESCLVEEYDCGACAGGATFPRHNDPRVLLRTRRGRCGEYANCFALLCRALGYDTRYVFGTTDHVWCEVFDYDSNSWIHADPCEAKLNAPLLYSHGWNKRLSYVIAVSRDDLQDVTWRYTCQHKDVLSRRNHCTETELLCAILQLRERRQAQVSAPRRRYLAERALRELIQLLVERKPEEYESQGRLSGSLAWRHERGEAGATVGNHVFQFDEPGQHAIRYYTSSDKYEVSSEGQEARMVLTWAAGLFSYRHVFRKVESDWKQVYLAREEGENSGTISWKLACSGTRMVFQTLSLRVDTALYETGRIEWSLKFDEHEPKAVKLGVHPTHYNRRFNTVVVTAQLTGGLGSLAWQHAQLFRQPLDSVSPAFEIQAQVVREDAMDLD